MVGVLLMLDLQAAPEGAQPVKCSLAGSVVNSVTGEPLGRVQLIAEPAARESGTAAATITDAKGGFRMIRLEAGSYRLKAVRNGFLDTWYGARRADSKGALVKLEPGQELTDLTLKMKPFAVLAGTVRDSDGEPVVGATLSVLRLQYEDGRRRVLAVRRAQSDDLGHCRVPDVPPGRYYIRARPKADESAYQLEDHSADSSRRMETFVPTLYPGALDAEMASTVEVTAGARLEGLDIADGAGAAFPGAQARRGACRHAGS